jgi:hypothetical protein
MRLVSAHQLLLTLALAAATPPPPSIPAAPARAPFVSCISSYNTNGELLENIETNLNDASLIYSNLGGQGGRPALLPRIPTRQEMRMGNVARLRDGTVIDLVITNRSECTQQQPHTPCPHQAYITHARILSTYHTARLPRPLTLTHAPSRIPRAFPADRAFSATQNGLLPKGEGVFGAFNLRASSASSTGARPPASIVELRFAFMANGSNVPVVLPRTQLTFYDLGSGLGGLRECMQIRGTHASSTMSFVSDKTELTADEYNASGASGSFRAPIQDLLNIVPAGGSPVRFLYPSTDPSATPLYCSTAQGVGADKPQDPYMLTGVQRTRSVIIDFRNVASFDVRHSLSHSLSGGITGGRDFLFGGLSNVMPPFCDFSSPSGAAASSKEHPRHTISGNISADSFKEHPGRRLQNMFTPLRPPPLPPYSPPPPPLPPLSPGCRCSNECVGAAAASAADSARQRPRSYADVERARADVGTRGRGEVALVVMTKNDVPLLSRWLIYHGHVFGFENIYVFDGSDSVQVAYLEGAAVRFPFHLRHSRVDLNKITGELLQWMVEIKDRYEWILKVDTDEFMCYAPKGKGKGVPDVSSSSLHLPKGSAAEMLRIQWKIDVEPVQSGSPTESTCAEIVPANVFKLIYSGPRFVNNTFNLGGHSFTAAHTAPGVTVVNYHNRNYEELVRLAMQTILSHGYIKATDSRAEMIRKLKRLDARPACRLNSCHKNWIVLDDLRNHTKMRSAHYASNGKARPVLHEWRDYLREIFLVYPSLLRE